MGPSRMGYSGTTYTWASLTSQSPQTSPKPSRRRAALLRAVESPLALPLTHRTFTSERWRLKRRLGSPEPRLVVMRNKRVFDAGLPPTTLRRHAASGLRPAMAEVVATLDLLSLSSTPVEGSANSGYGFAFFSVSQKHPRRPRAESLRPLLPARSRPRASPPRMSPLDSRARLHSALDRCLPLPTLRQVSRVHVATPPLSVALSVAPSVAPSPVPVSVFDDPVEEPSVFRLYERLNKELQKRKAKGLALTKPPTRLSRVLPLSQLQGAEVDRLWRVGDAFSVCDHFNLDVKARDLKTLREGRWLNDTIIDFYLALLTNPATATATQPRSCAFTTHFYTTLSTKGTKAVARWAKRRKMDVTSFDYVFVPVNIQNAHWALAVVNNKDGRFEYHDSLERSAAADMRLHLVAYMKEEATRLGAPVAKYDAYPMKVVETAPRQKNGYDCGVFTCTNVAYLSRGEVPSFTQTDMPNLRRRMAYEIATALLL